MGNLRQQSESPVLFLNQSWKKTTRSSGNELAAHRICHGTYSLAAAGGKLMTCWIHATIARIRALFFRGRLDSELNDELTAHIEMLTDDNMRRGMDRET